MSICYITKFDLVISLTQKGLEHYQDVAEAVFQYAHNLKDAGPQERFANELNSIGKLKFDFPDRTDPLKLCVKLAGKSRKLYDNDMRMLYRHSLVREAFDPKLMKNISEMICDLDRVNIFIHTPENCNSTEKYFGTAYDPVPTNDEFWENMKFPRIYGTEKINVPEPEGNNYVPQNMEMLELFPEYTKQPVKLDSGDSWYMQDEKFQHPKAIVHLQIKTRDLDLGTDPQTQLFVILWR